MNHHHDENHPQHHQPHCHNKPKDYEINSNKGHNNHDKHTGHSVAMFRDKFWLSLAFSLLIIVYSPMIQMWFHFEPPKYIGADFIPLILGIILFFYGGSVFIKSAWQELKSKTPGMMTLISLAITASFGYSLLAQLFLDKDGFFWELASLITIMLLGHWLEMAAVAKAQGSLDSIASLLPDKAEKLVGSSSSTIEVKELKVGDKVLVRPGFNIPVDGKVIEGKSLVDEAAISGESKSILKEVGSEVIAGTTNQDGSLIVEVVKVGSNTTLAGIMRLVKKAQQSKSNTQVLADKAAYYLTFIAVGSSLITFIYWLIAQDLAIAIERSITVLIIACPHALGLAIPLVVSISTSLSARNGLLVQKRIALESARNIDWVLFDKTGTLTQGQHKVVSVWPMDSFSGQDILMLMASLEQHSEHIIGRALVAEAKSKRVKLLKLTNFKSLPGVGVSGKLSDGKNYRVVSERYLIDEGLQVPAVILDQKNKTFKDKTIIYLLQGKKSVIGAVALADTLRKDSAHTIRTLKDMGIKTAMVTGDSQLVADDVAKKLNLDKYFAEVKPADKAKRVRSLQARGQKVAFVGDGINDAPALVSADIGIAIGAGTDVAIKSADIMLVNSNPSDLLKVIKLSRSTYQKMQQNLFWATGYNIIALPLAAGVLSSLGVILSPAIGAILMTISTVVVALNAQLLRKVNLTG